MKPSGCLYWAILFLCCISTESKSWKPTKKIKNDNNGWQLGRWKQLLREYGYTKSDTPSTREIKDAIVKLRILYQFDNTKTDEDILKFIERPRCGNRDINEKRITKRRVRRYELNPTWTTKSFKYAIGKYSSDLSVQQQDDIAAQAFQLWKNSVPELDFTPSGYDEAHIKIRFETGAHGCTQEFDGVGAIVAHAYLPIDGRIHLDDGEQFTDQNNADVNLHTVLVHEIGHALGLGHSFVQGAMMNPFYQQGNPGTILHEDDINGMRMLYAPETAADPNCIDQDPSLCALYKDEGYCIPDYADVMIETCPYTCNLCQ